MVSSEQRLRTELEVSQNIQWQIQLSGRTWAFRSIDGQIPQARNPPLGMQGALGLALTSGVASLNLQTVSIPPSFQCPSSLTNTDDKQTLLCVRFP